jgi:hypothetical protein
LGSSGLLRQENELEYITVDEYMGPLSAPSQELLELVLAQVKVDPNMASARMMVRNMMIFTGFFGTKGLGRGAKSVVGFAEGPADEAIFTSFAAHLQGLGVRIHREHALLSLQAGDGRVSRALVRTPSGETTAVTADWYISAVPQNVFPAVVDKRLTTIDPTIARQNRLGEQWLGGVQLYVAGAPKLPWLSIATGPWQCVTFDWARTIPDFPQHYGDGRINQWISIDLQTWDVPGPVHGKTARQATREEFVDELLHCLAMADPTTWGRLDRRRIVRAEVSTLLQYRPGRPVANSAPLFAGVVGALSGQPDPITKIGNLFLAASWARTVGGIDAMDCACEAARRSANAILDRTGYQGQRAFVQSDQPGPGLKQMWDDDDRRFLAGLPNAYDTIRPYRGR